MEQIVKDIRNYLLNKRITNIKFFNINESYFDLSNRSMWVIDGGIQIDLDEGVFSFGWNFEQESFDLAPGSTMDALLGDSSDYEIDLMHNSGLESIIGSEIIDVEFKLDFFQEFNEDAELNDKKIFFPVMILLKFRLNDFLQLALISYDIQEEPFDLVNPEFNLEGELLISHNREIKIANAEQ